MRFARRIIIQKNVSSQTIIEKVKNIVKNCWLDRCLFLIGLPKYKLYLKILKIGIYYYCIVATI